jgi:hypothetical protein
MKCILSTTYFGPIQWYQKLNRFDCIIDGEEPFVKQTYRNRCIIATTQGTQSLTVPIEHSDVRRMMDELGRVRQSREEEVGRTKDELGSASSFETSHSPQGEILHPSKSLLPTSKDIRISDHGNWRHLHWNALKSAYGESPFFEFYADDIHPFFEKKWKYLFDFNAEITLKMCELLDIQEVGRTKEELGSTSSFETSHSPQGEILLPSKFHHPTSKDFRQAIQPKHPQPDEDFTIKPYYQVYQQKHGFIPNLSILDLLFNMGNEAILYL